MIWCGQFIPTTKFIHATIQTHTCLLPQLGTWLKMALEPSSTSQQLSYYLHHGKLQCYPFFTSTCSVLCKKTGGDHWPVTIWETISNNYEFALKGSVSLNQKHHCSPDKAQPFKLRGRGVQERKVIMENLLETWRNLSVDQGLWKTFKQTSRQASLNPYVRAKVMFIWECGKTKQWQLAILIQFESQWSFATWEKLKCTSLASHFLIGHEYGNSKAQK